MKRYAIAALAALAGFAFFASAAGLVVRAPVLQVGQADVPTCTETADIVAWHYNDHLDGGPISGVAVELQDGHTCGPQENLYVTLLGAGGDAVTPGSPVGGVPLVAGQNSYTVNFPTPWPSGSDITGVRIGIDQGHANWVHPAP